MPLEFGIFDHLDDNGVPLADLFETRLKLIERYDRAGFRSYHIAEHHSTPGHGAVAQRLPRRGGATDERLRFGPLLYITPMYHPLRVAEEVVMLDHVSRAEGCTEVQGYLFGEPRPAAELGAVMQRINGATKIAA